MAVCLNTPIVTRFSRPSIGGLGLQTRELLKTPNAASRAAIACPGRSRQFARNLIAFKRLELARTACRNGRWAGGRFGRR